MGGLLSEALTGLGTSLVSLADEVLDNHLALEYLLAEQGRVCAITNTSCCTWIKATGQVKVDVKEIYTQAEWFHNFGRGDVTFLVWSTVQFSPVPQSCLTLCDPMNRTQSQAVDSPLPSLFEDS